MRLATNLFRRFMDIFPKQPLLVAEIISGTDPNWDVTFTSGGSQRVFAGGGTYVIGDFVYVRDGVIVGPAPTLADSTIDL